jgi:putative sterol carrier protein
LTAGLQLAILWRGRRRCPDHGGTHEFYARADIQQQAGPVNLVLQFDLTGDDGGEWVVEIADGVCSTRRGETEDPTATIRTSAKDFIALFMGELNAVAAYMNGRVQVAGDVTAIMNLLSFFDLPHR